MKRQKLVKKPEIEKYIRHYKPFLGLSDWDHRLVMDMSKAGDEIASVVSEADWKLFYMVFAPRVYARYRTKHPAFVNLETTVIHELIHVALSPLLEANGAALTQDQDKLCADWIEEPFVESLARVLAKYLPRPR